MYSIQTIQRDTWWSNIRLNSTNKQMPGALKYLIHLLIKGKCTVYKPVKLCTKFAQMKKHNILVGAERL